MVWYVHISECLLSVSVHHAYTYTYMYICMLVVAVLVFRVLFGILFLFPLIFWL